MTKYYGKVIEISCPDCGRPMETTLRNGGWTVDCQYMSPLVIIEGDEHCEGFDYYYWNSILYPTEEEAIDAHVALREEQ